MLGGVSVLLMAPDASAAPPSFDCRTHRSTIERLICSDPDLSRLDVEMNNAYGEALKRAGPKSSAAIRDDQREYNRHSIQGVEHILNDASPTAPRKTSDDKTYSAFGRDAAVDGLKLRMEERIQVLRTIEPERTGFVGQWRSQSGTLDIVQTPAGLKVTAETSTFGWTRYWCQVGGLGHMEGATLVVDDKGLNDVPIQLHFTRDGVRLTSRLTDGQGRLCPRGGELEKTVHFLPVHWEAKAQAPQ